MNTPFFKKPLPSKLFIKYFWLHTYYYTIEGEKKLGGVCNSYERWKAWRLLGAL